jgi:hypothetical protein
MQKGGFGLKKSLEAGLFIGRGNNGDENRTVSLPGEEHRVGITHTVRDVLGLNL